MVDNDKVYNDPNAPDYMYGQGQSPIPDGIGSSIPANLSPELKIGQLVVEIDAYLRKEYDSELDELRVRLADLANENLQLMHRNDTEPRLADQHNQQINKLQLKLDNERNQLNQLVADLNLKRGIVIGLEQALQAIKDTKEDKHIATF